MLKKAIPVCSIVIAISFCSVLARAQWTVHALAGKMRVVNVDSKILIIEANDGTDGIFQLPENDKLKLSFDKDVRAATIAPEKAVGDTGQVIVFFFDNGDLRTAVAVESVGDGPFQKLTGTVLKYDKHDRVLTLQTPEGEKSVAISDKTIVDTPDGVVPGRKFSAERGDHLRLLAQTKAGVQQTVLVRFDGNPT